VLSKVLFPQAGREEVDLQGRMGIDALPHIDQIDRGIDALEATGGQQTLDDPHMARPYFRPTEHPVFAAQRKGSTLPLQMIGINRDLRIGQKHFEFGFPLQRLPRRLPEGIGGQPPLRDHGVFEPGKEGGAEGFGILTAGCQLRLRFHPVRTDLRFLPIEALNVVERRSH
jgi:hypothetical protein